MGSSLLVIETHPIQYRAPVYRALRQVFNVPVLVMYGSDFSVAGYYDKEFRSAFSWDTDLLSGYESVFLSRVAEGGAKAYEAVSAQGLGQAIRRVRPAAILLPGYGAKFLQWAWVHALLSGCPIFFRGETADRPQSSGGLKLTLRRRLLEFLYRRAARLLYIGQRSRDHYLEFGCSDDKLVFSPYCVDPSPFEPGEERRAELRNAARAEMGVAASDRVILFSGKLSERKGPDLLIEAVRSLASECRSNTVVVFLGNGDLADALEKSAAREPAVRVRFAGFRNQKEISPYFHAADLFVLPSRRLETWGLVVNEALLHGLPCIVSDAVGCGPDLVTPGVTGEVFASGSASELASAITRASGLIGRADVRRACRDRVAGYSIERAAQGIAEAYASVVE